MCAVGSTVAKCYFNAKSRMKHPLQPASLSGFLGGEGIAMRTPEQQANFDLISETLDRVTARRNRRDFAALTEAERVFLTVWWVEAEVNNGGFHQYFFNSAGDQSSGAERALETIRASRCARIVAAAIAVFPPPGPSPDRYERQRQLLDGLPSDAEDSLDALDHAFYEYPDDVETLLADFVRAHASEFPSV
jgi:hypothetical protein